MDLFGIKGCGSASSITLGCRYTIMEKFVCEKRTNYCKNSFLNKYL